MRIPIQSIWLLAFLLVCAAPAQACSVPVFRYALERWDTTPYRAVVFHRGKFSESDQRCVVALKDAGEATNATANIHLELVDLDAAPNPKVDRSTARAMERLWAAQKDATLPWMVLLYPDGNEELSPIWSGPLNAQQIAKTIASPMRAQVARRLAVGDSAVWVLLAAGDKAQDDAAQKVLDEELSELEKTIALPKEEDSQGGPTVKLRSELPLKIAFSTVVLYRSDPAEAMFVAMLTGMDKRFRDVSKPIAFPIFGRGRALTGLTGKDLTATTIEEAASFLTGACSCQVKELNPGVDMLFDTDWEGILDGSKVAEKVPAVPAKLPFQKQSEASRKTPERVPLPQKNADVESATCPIQVVRVDTRQWLYVGAALSAAMVLATGILLVRAKKK